MQLKCIFRYPGEDMSSLIVNLFNELDCAITNDDASDIWGNAGSRELDNILALISDYYIQYSASRDEIRDEIKQLSSTWPLIIFVRRISQLIKSVNDTVWFNRGLATASMVNANCDYRDLIVSLVLLRDSADRAGIQTTPAFNVALRWSTDQMHGILSNARDHSVSAICSTVAAFGPPSKLG